MTEIEKFLHTDRPRTSEGRGGHLDVNLSSPGSAASGTNPEHLFAAGSSTPLIGAISIAAAKRKINLRKVHEVNVEAGPGRSDDIYFLQATSM